MSTLCDRFGQQGAENELTEGDQEQREDRLLVEPRNGGGGRPKKWGERRERATMQGRRGPLCGSLADNGLIRPDVAFKSCGSLNKQIWALRRWT